jgi:hypothetical protein
MSRPHALALTERQMRVVQKHSASLKLQMRDRFLQVVADRLTGEVSDDALMAAINLALDHLHAFRQAKAAS